MTPRCQACGVPMLPEPNEDVFFCPECGLSAIYVKIRDNCGLKLEKVR